MSSRRHWVLKGSLGALGLVSAGLGLTPYSAPVLAVSTHAERADSRLPAIKQVAILPVYWQGKFPESYTSQTLQKHIDKSFTQLAQASKRFSFTHDVITADLWASPEGRKELIEEYEIDAMLSLSVSGQNDLMSWTVRLLSPKLETYLSETERVPYNWFLAASPAEIDQRLQNLLFRLLNRYPIDVFVTSVQGRYVSLSSGQSQNIFEGDELTFYETKLKAQHPIDGSWLSFDQKLLGKARVIESQQQSSIALITSLSYENAIKMGDGAKVAETTTRRTFQQTPASAQRYVPVGKDSAIVAAPGQEPSLPSSPSPPSSPQFPTPSPDRPPKAAGPMGPRVAAESSQSNQVAADTAPTPQPAPSTPLPSEESNSSPLPLEGAPEGEVSIGDWIAATFNEVHLIPSLESLSFRGANSLTSTLPSWMINRISAKGYQKISSEWLGIYGSTLRMGDSKRGDYLGLSASGEGLYMIPALQAEIPSLDHILVGGIARLETLGVDGETFGGWNAALVGPSIHMQGSHHLVEQVQTIDYDFALRYFGVALGSAGISGTKRDLEQGSAWEVELSAVARGRSEDWEWGAQALAHSGSWALSRGSLDHEVLVLGLIGRRRF